MNNKDELSSFLEDSDLAEEFIDYEGKESSKFTFPLKESNTAEEEDSKFTFPLKEDLEDEEEEGDEPKFTFPLKENHLQEKLPKDLRNAYNSEDSDYKKTPKFSGTAMGTCKAGQHNKAQSIDFENANYKEISKEEALNIDDPTKLRIIKYHERYDGRVIPCAIYFSDKRSSCGLSSNSLPYLWFQDEIRKELGGADKVTFKNCIEVADKIYETDEADHLYQKDLTQYNDSSYCRGEKKERGAHYPFQERPSWMIKDDLTGPRAIELRNALEEINDSKQGAINASNVLKDAVSSTSGIFKQIASIAYNAGNFGKYHEYNTKRNKASSINDDLVEFKKELAEAQEKITELQKKIPELNKELADLDLEAQDIKDHDRDFISSITKLKSKFDTYIKGYKEAKAVIDSANQILKNAKLNLTNSDSKGE